MCMQTNLSNVCIYGIIERTVSRCPRYKLENLFKNLRGLSEGNYHFDPYIYMNFTFYQYNQIALMIYKH